VKVTNLKPPIYSCNEDQRELSLIIFFFPGSKWTCYQWGCTGPYQ